MGESKREPTYQEVLDVLAEECAEVIHIISKMRRFGIEETHPDTGVPNEVHLREELFDLLAMINWSFHMSKSMPLIDEILNHETMKRDKVRRYLREQ